MGNFLELKELFLTRNQIKDDGIEYLSKAYFHNLIELDLGRNLIEEKGVKYLSKAKFTVLKKFHL